METHEKTVRGIRMRWEQAGEGMPVVLIHGIPTSPALWRHVVPLVEGARCLAFEMVGYGESIPEGRDRDISVAQQAAYLLGWLEELGIDRAIYVGRGAQRPPCSGAVIRASAVEGAAEALQRVEGSHRAMPGVSHRAMPGVSDAVAP